MATKVYELATEIGVGAIDLVEKLKTMGFNVRNHMASLTDDEVAKAKAAYESKQKTSTHVKKAVVRKVIKKEVAAAAEEVVPVKEEAPAIVEDVPVAGVQAIQEVEATSNAPAEKQYIDDKPKGLTIVKRKTKAQKEEEDKKAQEVREEAAAHAAAQANAPKDDGPAPASSYNTSRNAPGKKEYFEEKRHSFTPIFTPFSVGIETYCASCNMPLWFSTLSAPGLCFFNSAANDDICSAWLRSSPNSDIYCFS